MEVILGKIFFIVSLLTLFISIFIIYVRFGLFENFFSPLNTFLNFQLITLIFQVPYLFSEELYSYLQANYFREFIDNSDFAHYSTINIFCYAIFNLSLYIFLVMLKYKPVKLLYNDFSVSNFEYIFFLVTMGFWTFYNIKEINFPFSPSDIRVLRYNLEHGFNAIFHKLALIFSLTFLLVLYNLPRKNIYLKLLSISFLIFFLIYGFISGTRGVIIFGSMILLFSKYSKITYDLLLRQLYYGYINRNIFFLVSILIIVISYYYIYSTNIKGYEGNVFSVISQRLDFMIASAVALKEIKPSLHLEYLMYPFISYFPRDIFQAKPYPVNAELTYAIFGYIEGWSVNFGVVGESLYILPIIWLVVSALAVSISLKLLGFYFKKRILNIYDIGTIIVFFLYPTSVLTSGILNPATGDLIYLGSLFMVLSYVRDRRILL
jgi:hypothetical protein